MRHLSRLLILLSAVSLTACGEADEVPSLGGDPTKYLNQELRGYAAPVGIMMGKDNKAFWIASTVKDYAKVTGSDVPSDVSFIDPNSGCGFSKPEAGEFFAKVHVGSAEQRIPMYGISRDEIGRRTNSLIKNVQKDPSAPRKPETNREVDQFKVVDVVVTETSKPVYLVLTYNDSIMFNFQIAEGAKLSRIAMIGWDAGGVVNVDPSVKISALTGDRMQACKATPQLKPREHWVYVQNMKALGGEMAEESLKKNHGYASAFTSWFMQHFGQPAEPGMIGASVASHVLVGPQPATPEARIAFKPLAQSKMRITPIEYIVGSKEDYLTKNKELIVAKAEQLMGNKLSID
jgi:hypothetical protein